MNNICENDKIRAAYAKMYMVESEEAEAQNSAAETASEPQNASPKVGEHALTKEHEANPAVRIGTYGNYNDGSLAGEGEASGWVDLTTFADADEFHEWLDEQANGKDVEWMFKDYQCFPKSLYNEGNVDRVWEYIDFKDNTSLTDEQVDALLEEYPLEEVIKKDDNGDIILHSGCSSFGDIAQEMIDEMGTDAFTDEDYQSAFDYEAFGRDVNMDWDESANEGKSAYETFGVSEDDDKALGEAYVDQVCGNISELGNETIMRYMDYESLGSDLRYDGNWIECDGDMIEVRN